MITGLGLLVRHAPRFRDEITVGVAACISFAVLIAVAGGIPYGLDGNETFSSIVHAYNLLNFDFSFAKGLADETYSSSPAAHSFVHTHQGNFPRLFASLIYGVGLKSPEAQIIATAATVGVASVVVWFRFIADVFNRRVAGITTAFMLTDYVLFLQWHLVTYRTWQLFFISACFYSVYAFARSGDRRWYGALFGIWCGLFYYEILFAIFTATAVGLWTLWILQSRPTLAFGALGVCFAGAIAGAGTVFVQLALFLGWHGALQDLLGTFLVRNAAGSVADSMAQIKAFADEHHIVFFLNLIDGRMFRTIDFAIRCLTSWGFLVYSPAMAQLIVHIVSAAAIHSVRRPCLFWAIQGHPVVFTLAGLLMLVIPGTSGLLLASAVTGWSVLVGRAICSPRSASANSVGHETVVLWMIWYAALLVDQRTLGDLSVAPHWFGLAGSLISAAILGCFTAYGVAAALQNSASSVVGRINLLLLIFIACAGFAGVHTVPPSGAFWRDVLGSGLVATFAPKVVLAVSAAALSILMVATRSADVTSAMEVVNPAPAVAIHARQIGAFALCMVTGLMCAVLLLPGYLYSGYMVRYCNFLAPVLAVFAGYGLSWLITASIDGYCQSGRNQWMRGAGIASAVTIVVMLAAWCTVQLTMLKLLRSGEFANLYAELRKHQGASVVANTYAAPFFIATGGWAYLDSKFGSRDLFRRDSGYDYSRDQTYLWLADRIGNLEYQHPALYVCLATPGLPSLMEARLLGTLSTGQDCGSNRMVQLARAAPSARWPSPKLLAVDQSGGYRWAVVKIDYDFPPYLDGPPEVIGQTTAASFEVAVSYAYRHQSRTPEEGTIVKLIALPKDFRDCQAEGRVLAEVDGRSGRARLVLPKSQMPMDGYLIVAVEPATASRRGSASYSILMNTSGAVATRDSSCDVQQVGVADE